MKKFEILMALAMIASPALADFWTNCTTFGGKIITANSYGNDKGGKCNDPSNPDLSNNCNGKRFCIGSQAMNWWSTFTWCESLGGEPATFDSLCPTCSQVWGYCPNLKSILSSGDLYRGNAPRNSDSTWLFNLKDGIIDYAGGGHRGFSYKPICQEK